MEVVFILEIAKGFFLEYWDPADPHKPVRDFFKIAKNYIFGNFFYNLIACSAWPLHEYFKDSMTPDEANLIYLLRLFRMTNIAAMLDMQNFTTIIRNYYRK